MEWLKELQAKFESGVAHQFILYLNIKDIFLKEEAFKKLDNFLSSSILDSAGIVVFYNRGTGLRFPNKEMEKYFVKLLIDPKSEARSEELPIPPYQVFPLLNTLLRISWENDEVKEILGEEKAKEIKDKTPPIAIVIEYAESLVPPDAATSSNSEDRNQVVLFQQWAQDERIQENRNLILLITESLASVAPALREPSSGIVPLKIPFPDLVERKEIIEVLRKSYPRQDQDIAEQSLAHLTAGLNRFGVREIIQDAHYHQRILTPAEVFSQKKKILEEQSGGLIEIQRPPWGMEAIGDLKPHKSFIKKTVEAMKRNDPLVVPMGILMIGPPGTGKTIFAEALAHEADIPLIILKNIREMWVGQSERNLDLVFELIRAQAPVIVFQDEIDQQIQMRGAVFHGDTGVSARLAGQQYAFMSDTTLRGRVVWLAATNRPDLLDPALLRPGRFDEKIPFLPPDVNGRGDIIQALLKKMETQAGLVQASLNWELSPEEIEELAKKARFFWNERSGKFYKDLSSKADKDDFKEISYTGAEIEVVLRKAYVRAQEQGSTVLSKQYIEEALEDYIPTKDLIIYHKMADLALMEADSEQFLEEKWKKEAIKVRAARIKQSREELI